LAWQGLEKKNLEFTKEVEERFKYEIETINLRAGDSLLFYTDGLIDAANFDGRLWGRENMLEGFVPYPEIFVKRYREKGYWIDRTLGEEFEIRIDLANVAKETGLLVRIDEMIPRGFEVAKEPVAYFIEGNSLNAKGKQLPPQKVESLTISLKATQTGNFQLCPQVIYVDELGKFKKFKCEANQMTVLPPTGFQFTTNNAQMVFEHLTKTFIEDYMTRRLPLDKSGWRTLIQIQTNTKVPKSTCTAQKNTED
jgi:hypothetical protein